MSASDFIKNPYKYSSNHIICFDTRERATRPSEAGMEEFKRKVKRDNHGQWNSVHFKPSQNVYTDLGFAGDTLNNQHKRIGKKEIHMIQCRPGNADKGIRFLPWSQDSVTFMQLDKNATTFFTGPLSGCSIYLGYDTSRNVWAFHANRNAVQGQDNSEIKKQMTIKTNRDDIPQHINIKHAVLYGKQYNDLGFVFGQKSGSGWKFYVADTGTIPNVNPAKYQTTVTQLT